MPLFVWAAIAIAVVVIGASTIIVPPSIVMIIVNSPIGYAIAIVIVVIAVTCALASLRNNKEDKQ